MWQLSENEIWCCKISEIKEEKTPTNDEVTIWNIIMTLHRIEKSDLINVSKGNWNLAEKFMRGGKKICWKIPSQSWDNNNKVWTFYDDSKVYRNHLGEHDSSPCGRLSDWTLYPFNHPNILNNSVASRWVNFNLFRFAAMLEYWFRLKYDETRKQKVVMLVHRKFTLQHLRME